MADINKRIGDLQQALSPDVIGVQWDEGDVNILKTGEHVSLAEFAQRHPDGVLIHVIHRDMSEVSDGEHS